MKLVILRIQRLWHSLTKHINFTYILFFISLILFISVLLPSFAQKIPFYDLAFTTGSFPTKRTIEGNITIPDEDGTTKLPASNAIIYCGGYRTVSDYEGVFSLDITSVNVDKIALIIIYDNCSYLFWLEITENLYSINQEFYLYENNI